MLILDLKLMSTQRAVGERTRFLGHKLRILLSKGFDIILNEPTSRANAVWGVQSGANGCQNQIYNVRDIISS